jgi:hypothetical protein
MSWRSCIKAKVKRVKKVEKVKMDLIRKRFVFCLLALLVVYGVCRADVTKLSAEHRKALQDIARFREMHAVKDLPAAIVALCDDHGRLAEPGQKWQETDFITDISLAQRRLIWAAVVGEYYVAHYERGGRAHSFHVLIATLKEGKATVIWRGVGDHLKDYMAFLDALQGNKLDDRLDYAH